MGEIHRLRVKSPYKLIKIVDIEMQNKPNEHGYLYLKCLIDEEINFDSVIKASTEDEIYVYEEQEDTNNEEDININEVDESNSQRLFCGIVKNIKTTNIDEVYYLEIEALTVSLKLDIKEKSRSFQNVNMTYDALINEILEDYSGFTFTQNAGKGEKIDKPLFQYKETDWNFLKRIASELNSELYCNIVNFNDLFYFGIPSEYSHELDDDVDYNVFKDIKSFYEAGGTDEGYDAADYLYYEIETMDVLEIGSEINYKQKDLYVREYEAYNNNGQISYNYKLYMKNGVWQNTIYNELLKGATIEGEVIEVQNESVKLHLDIDETQNQEEAFWFPFLPPSVNIMYAIPLAYERVRLYFPNENGENPIVTGCVRKNGDTCENTSDSTKKYFETEHGSEIAMLPDELNIKGGSKETLSISLKDEIGITLTSPKGLNLNSDGEIVINTPKNIRVTAQSQILMTKGDASHGVSIEGEFHVKGNKVIKNGRSREAFSPYME